ncbi:MAG: LamG-like jellyroll fold domain-containing protein [Chitinophagia bacterium]
MKQLITLFLLSFLSLYTTAQMGLPIQQSVLPKNSLVVNYDFLKSSSFTRGSGTVTNIAGTASGNATIVNSPIFFNSLGFVSLNGSNQYLITPNIRTYFKNVNTSIQTSFTMSFWVYPTANNGILVYELESTTLNNGWNASNIDIVNGYVKYRVWNGPVITSPSTINLNQWYHIAMVYDGANLKGYINGVLQGTQTTARIIPTAGQFYAIGAGGNQNLGTSAFGTFNLAQYKIYNLPFSDSDILQDYESRKTEFDYTIHSPSTNSNPTYWGISSAWDNSNGINGPGDAFSIYHYTPWLNSILGWAALANGTDLTTNQWITLNYDEPAYIKGIVIQPRATNGNQFVTKVHVETSLTGAAPWTRVVSDVSLGTNITDDARVLFPTSVFAKSVKVIPVTWTNHITMRLGALVKPNNLISDGLVLRLDPANIKSYQSSGTTFKDLTTNLSDFTLVGTPTYNTNGFFTFNGTNQYASRANTASLKPSTAISIEQWLNADNWNAGTSASYKCALSCTQVGGYSHNIWSGNFYSYIYAGGKYLTPSASVSNFVGWHHFVTTFDGRYAKLYIDGSLANTDDYGSANRTMTYVSNSIFLGAEAGASTTPEGYYWQGKIATTAIYNKALSDAEILQNFNNTKVRYNIVQDGLVANFINPPSSGTTWTDASGNGNNATLNGSPTYTSANGGGYTTSSSSYISTNYNLGSSYTISLASSFNPTSYWATLWGNESWNAGKGYIAYLLSNSSMNLGSSSGLASISVTGINSIHIWDFVASGTSYTLYKDGVSVSTGTYTAPSGGVSTNGLYFGARHGNDGTSYTDALPGTYYSMRVYNRALSADEINTNFSVLRGNYGL